MNTPKPKTRKPFTAYIPRGPCLGPFDYPRCRCIPLDAASVAEIRKRARWAILLLPRDVAYYSQHSADAVLAAIGIKRRKTK